MLIKPKFSVSENNYLNEGKIGCRGWYWPKGAPWARFSVLCLCVSVYRVWGGDGHFIGGQQVGGPFMKLVLWSLGCAPVLFSVPGDSVYLRPHGTCFKLA